MRLGFSSELRFLPTSMERGGGVGGGGVVRGLILSDEIAGGFEFYNLFCCIFINKFLPGEEGKK